MVGFLVVRIANAIRLFTLYKWYIYYSSPYIQNHKNRVKMLLHGHFWRYIFVKEVN